MLDKTRYGWWKSAVFYQIYPKSFLDTDGDGVGDLRGIIEKLDYLAQLGIDGIWLSPVCASPQADNGYDISDYCAIDPMFGGMKDMETLIAEAKKRGISIIMDLVLNHSSDEHPWFIEAKKSRDNPYHDYYVWRDGDGVTPPNDMRATFGGSAWTYVPEIGQYYFHQFAVKQPDLNWENPQLRRALYKCIRFWVDKGVEGFRLDVIDQIAKEPDRFITANGPKLHEFLRELSAEAFCEEGLVTVGETWGADVERARLYSAPDASELSMVFQFEHMCLDQEGEKWDVKPLSLPALKRCYAHWQEGLFGKGWNSLFMNNHDLPRIVSRWGDDGTYRVQSAKMLAAMLHGMQGTPYIYQGEELGMTNIRLPIEQYVDIEILNCYKERTAAGHAHEDVMASIWARGRDNARTPMQWTAGENAGFTTGTPWLPVNENHTQINAEAALNDQDSVFYFYKKLIALRKTLPVFESGRFTLLCPEDEQVFAYTRDTDREHLLVVCNFSKEEAAFAKPEGYEKAQKLLGNYEGECGVLRPYETQVLYVNDADFSDVSNVVFDLYGTLVDIHTDEERETLWQAMAEYYTERGAAYTPDVLRKAYLALVTEKEAGLAAGMSDVHEAHPEIQIEEVFAALFERAGVKVSRGEAVAAGLYFRRQSTDYIRLYPGAKQLLLQLREAGKKVYLLSNAQAIFTRWEMNELGIEDCLDGVLLSSDYGIRKPDARFFNTLLERYAITPKDAVMVGNDGRCDIMGAQAVGMKTIYIRSNISPKEPLPKADAVFTQMDLERVQALLV